MSSMLIFPIVRNFQVGRVNIMVLSIKVMDLFSNKIYNNVSKENVI